MRVHGKVVVEKRTEGWVKGHLTWDCKTGHRIIHKGGYPKTGLSASKIWPKGRKLNYVRLWECAT